MSAWASKRKTLYFSFLGLLVLGFIFIFVVPRFQNPPTCSDGIQNGNEGGVDCGAGCPLYCEALARPLVVAWSRSFPVVSGRYNAFALIENQNTDTALHTQAYEFRLYDENNVFVGRKTGVTYIPHNGQRVIVEPGIDTGNRVVARTEFEWIENPVWLNLPPRLTKENVSLRTSNIVMEDPFLNPRLRAVIQNNGSVPVYDVDVVALLYNQSGSLISASATFVDSLRETESKEIFFTWQDGFVEDPVRIELIPTVNPFQIGRFGDI